MHDEEPPRATNTAAHSCESPAELVETRPAPCKVLVVEDEKLLRAMLARLLGRHDVYTAASGHAALELLKHDQDFDLILCDLVMPDMSGIEVHRALEQLDAPLAERLVFMSGGGFPAVVAAYLERAHSRLLEKPFDKEQLLRLVSERAGAARSAIVKARST